MGVSNMRYFNARQIAFDHCEEEREINRALHEDIVVEGDGMDLELEDLEHTWMGEDAPVGIVEVTCGCSTCIGSKVVTLVGHLSCHNISLAKLMGASSGQLQWRCLAIKGLVATTGGFPYTCMCVV
jgi:hypothetical protein